MLPGGADTPPAADEAIARAYRALRSGAHDEALEAVNTSLAARPDSPVALTLRGMVLSDSGKIAPALADLTRAIELDPEYALARLIRGWAYAREKLNNPAIADFDTVLRLVPEHPAALTGRALARLQKEEHEDALHDVDQALATPTEFTPEDAAKAAARLREADLLTVIRETWARDEWESLRPTAYCIRGLARAALGQTEPALADLSEAVRLRPKDVAFRLERAAVFARVFLFRPALDDYRAASQLAPEDPAVHLLAAATAATIGEKATALEHAATAARLRPADGAVLVNAADTYLQCGDAERAEKTFTQAIALKPPLATAFAGLAAARLAGGRTSSVAELIRQAENAGLPAENVHMLRASLLRAEGDPDGAMDALKEALAANPRLIEARRMRSEIRHARRDVLGADRELERALESTPDAVEIMIARAWLQLEFIDDRIAMEMAKQARAIAPRHPQVLYFDTFRAIEDGDWSGATERVNALLPSGLFPEGALRSLRGIAALEAGRIPESLVDWEWLKDQGDPDPFFESLRANCLVASGSLKQAIEVLKEAVKHEAGEIVRMDLALCLWRAGDPEQASSVLQPLRAKADPFAIAWDLQIRGHGASEEARAALTGDERLALSKADQFVLHYERGVVLGAELRNPRSALLTPGRRYRAADEPVEEALLLSAARAADAGEIEQARRYLEAAVKFTSATKIGRHLAARWLAELAPPP